MGICQDTARKVFLNVWYSVYIMKAVFVEKYGSPEVAHVKEVETPTIQNTHDILVAVKASSVNSGDARLRRADPWFVRLVFGLFGPRKKVLGGVFAGVVSSVGNSVTKYKIGDHVYGMSESFMGGHAEFILVQEQTPMGIMPEHMSFEDAASLPFGATTALHFLKDVDLAGKSVCINGASGAVGVCFTQLAKHRGAHVTAITSTKNISLLQELGADTVIDYTTTNIVSTATEYDIVIDCVNKIPLNKIETLVKKGGVIILLFALIKESLQSLRITKAKVLLGTAKPTSAQFDEISHMYTQGALRPVIHGIFTLDEIVKAYRVVDSGKKVGSVVLKI